METLHAIGRFYRGFARFEGRTSRDDFWLVIVFLFVVKALCTLAFSRMGADVSTPGLALFTFGISGGDPVGTEQGTMATESAITGVFRVIDTAFTWVHALPILAITARRLHDAGLSRAWMFAGLVPLLGTVALILLLLQSADHRRCDRPECRAGDQGSPPSPAARHDDDVAPAALI